MYYSKTGCFSFINTDPYGCRILERACMWLVQEIVLWVRLMSLIRLFERAQLLDQLIFLMRYTIFKLNHNSWWFLEDNKFAELVSSKRFKRSY